MSMRVQSALLLALSFGCGTSERAHERARRPASEPAELEHSERPKSPGMADVPALETPVASDVYDPSPSELPLTEDFAAAAEKRVTPDNYQLQLETIARELAELAPKPAKGVLVRTSDDANTRRAELSAPKRAVSARGVAGK